MSARQMTFEEFRETREAMEFEIIRAIVENARPFMGKPMTDDEHVEHRRQGMKADIADEPRRTGRFR